MVDVRNIREVTKEARHYLAFKEAEEGIIKTAIIIDSNVSMIVGNIFLRFNKPNVPTKLFRDKASAIKWPKDKDISKIQL